MIRKRSELEPKLRENVRGGLGRAVALDYIAPGEMAGVEFVSLLTLEPGATIGEHPHVDAEELYLIVSGAGTGILGGERFPVEAGDAYLCKKGHSHALECGPSGPLTFLAVLATAGKN